MTITDKLIEIPKYTVLRALEGAAGRGWFGGGSTAELRQYAPYIIAETTIEGCGSLREASNQGFRRVANYIFGGNTSVTSDKASSEKVAMTAPVITQQQPASSEKIAMTAPVATSQQEASSGAYTLSFVMPSKYTMDTLPQPKDASVVLKQVPGYLAASLQFAGRVDADVEVRKREQELLTIIKANGLEPVGPPQYLRYDPPIMPGFLRRNEVVFPVREVEQQQ